MKPRPAPITGLLEEDTGVEKGVYIQDSLNNGARFFDVGEVYSQLKVEGGFEDADLWPINEEAIRLTMESGLPIDFVYTYNIDALLDQNKNVLDVNEIPFRVPEWRAIESYAEKYGYIRMGNSWIKELDP